MITISMISAAYTQDFLDAFASLGIEPWAGIEMDVAWGQTTLRFGLHRPSVTGPIFVYRVCTALRHDTPTRMQVLSHADLSPDQLLSAIAGQHPDLRDTWADGGWQLCTIDATRGHSRDRSLMHPCYILIQADDYWVFNHRPWSSGASTRQSRSVLPMCPTSDDQLPSSPSFSVATPSSWAIVPLASDVAQWGRGGLSAGQLLQWLLYTGRCGSEQHSHGEYQTCRSIDHPTAAHRPNGAD